MLKQAFIAAFILVLLLPGLQTALRLWDEVELHGVEAPVASSLPALHVSDFWHGIYQQSINDWLDRSIGFRGMLIRTDNQINFSVFREISSDYSSPLVLGADKTLFERLYIDNMNNQWSLPRSQIDAFVRSIVRLRNALATRGIALLVLLSPSKTTLYPDRVPARYRLPSASDPLKDNTARFVESISATDLPFVDGRTISRTVSEASGTPAFPRGGTHWTEFVACHVSQHIMSRASELLRRAIPAVRCEPTEEFDVPRPLDRDLADLANIWNPAPFYERLRYPQLPDQIPSSAPDDGMYRPRVLFVGGSFLWSIFVSLDFERIYASRDMLYYFQRVFHFPEGTNAPIKRASFDWDRYLLRQDLVVIEVNEAAIHQQSSGFIGAALQALEAAPPPPSDEASQTEPRDPTAGAMSSPGAPPHARQKIPGSTSDQDEESEANWETSGHAGREDSEIPPEHGSGE